MTTGSSGSGIGKNRKGRRTDKASLRYRATSLLYRMPESDRVLKPGGKALILDLRKDTPIEVINGGPGVWNRTCSYGFAVG